MQIHPHGTEIDYKNGKIILSFIDDIELNKDAEKKRWIFSIISEKMTNPSVDNFNKVEENINNYLIYAEESTYIKRKQETRWLCKIQNYNS